MLLLLIMHGCLVVTIIVCVYESLWIKQIKIKRDLILTISRIKVQIFQRGIYYILCLTLVKISYCAVNNQSSLIVLVHIYHMHHLILNQRSKLTTVYNFMKIPQQQIRFYTIIHQPIRFKCVFPHTYIFIIQLKVSGILN
jgi:hypothetical protein